MMLMMKVTILREELTSTVKTLVSNSFYELIAHVTNNISMNHRRGRRRRRRRMRWCLARVILYGLHRRRHNHWWHNRGNQDWLRWHGRFRDIVGGSLDRHWGDERHYWCGRAVGVERPHHIGECCHGWTTLCPSWFKSLWLRNRRHGQHVRHGRRHVPRLR